MGIVACLMTLLVYYHLSSPSLAYLSKLKFTGKSILRNYQSIMSSDNNMRKSTLSTSTSHNGLFNLKQSFNLPGIKALLLIFTDPAKLIPNIYIRHIHQLDVKKLKASGIECIVFDKDNTLRYYLYICK
jgi:hypothetical protein